VHNPNFISYALKASKEFNDPTIKRQIRRHWKKLNTAVSNAEKKLPDSWK
jgi:hypothetical protein